MNIKKVISKNVRSLEEKLSINVSVDQIENVSEKTLQTAVEMFTYLNYCPPQESFLKKKNLKWLQVFKLK